MTNQEKPLLSLYLFNGDDALKRETLLERLTKRIALLGDIDFNLDTFNAQQESTAGDIVSACNTLPFCSDIRQVVVKDVDKSNKTTLDGLTEYVASPCGTTVLVLVAEKLAKNTRLYKAIDKSANAAIVDCTSKKRNELPALVRSMAVSYDITISTGAATRLIELVGTSTIALDTELKKLSAYAKTKQSDVINEADIEKLIVRTAEIKPWELTDALASRDTERCLTLLARMQGQSPHGLLAMCLTRIRELITTKAVSSRRDGVSVASALGMPDWRVKNHSRWAAQFSRKELIDALRSAADLEKQMKSGGDPDLLFEQWIIRTSMH